jgi:tape measure domain-containing protein
MAIGKEIKVVLTLDDKGFKVGIRDASGSLQNFEKQLATTATSVKNVESHFTSFGAKAHQMVTTMGMARFALMDLRDIFLSLPLAVLKTSGEIERLTQLMSGLSRESDATKRKLEAAANVKFLFNMAQNAPFEVKALGDAFVKLKTGGLDPTNGSLKALVNGVARFGGTSEQLKRAAIAIQQMGGKGVVSMEELRQQLGEAVPNAMSAMAEGMAMSMAELSKKVATGTIGATSAMGKMLAVMGLQNAGAAAAMMDTWVGLIERLKTQWELFKLDIGAEGLFDEAKQAVKELTAALGGASGANLARSIGGTLNAAVTNVLDLTKALVEAWDWIKLVGQAWVTYWVASKVAGPILASVNGLGAVRDKLALHRDWISANLENEKRGMVAAELAKAESLRRQQAQNNQEIAAERAAAAEKRAIRVQELRDEIATNNAIMATNRQRMREAADFRNGVSANPLVAQRNVPGLLTTDQRQMVEGLLNQASAQEKAAVQAATYNRTLQAQQVALRQEATLLSTSSAALSETTLKKRALNAELDLAINKHIDAANAATRHTSALASLREAGKTVASYLGSMIFSMNGLVIAITAAIYAWQYFSDAAKQATREAKTALEMKDRLRRGTVNDDDTNDMKSVIAGEEKKLATQEVALAGLRRKRDEAFKKGLDTSAIEARIRAAEQEQQRLLTSVTANRGNLKLGIEQAEATKGQAAANQIAQSVEAQADKAAESFVQANEKLTAKLAEMGNKAPKADVKKILDERVANSIKGYEAQRDFLKGEAERYGVLAQEATKGSAKRTEYENAVKLINKQLSNANEQVIALNRPNDIIPKDKKDKQLTLEPTDDLFNKMNADARAINKANASMQNLNADLVELKQLKEQAQDEIDTIVDQDRHKKVIHTPEQEKEAVERLTNRKALELAVREMGAIVPKLESSKERLRQLEEQIATGNYRDAPNDEESKTLQRLEAIRRLAPKAGTAMEAVISKQKELLEASGKRDIASGLIDSAKRIRDLEVAGIVDARQRTIAEHQKEVDDAAHKYDRLLELALKYDQDTGAIFANRAKEIELINQKMARAIETPIKKLADEWKKGTDQLETATRSWAESFLDTMTTALSGGGLKWREFLVGMLKSTLDMHLKKSFGDQISGMFDGIGTKIGNLLGIARQAPAAALIPGAGTAATGAAAGVATSATATAVGSAATDAAQNAAAAGMKAVSAATDVAADAMVDMTTTGLADMATSTLMSALQTTGKMTVEQAATAGIAQMGLAAFGAATALTAAAAASYQAAASDTASAFFANGGIMSSVGSVPLRQYANGGIANSPQLAVFGEGAMNEAYVPLPDGRSIPVTISGGEKTATGGTSVVISIVVNEAEGGEQSSSEGDDDQQIWGRMAQRIKSVVREEMVTQARPGGILYK